MNKQIMEQLMHSNEMCEETNIRGKVANFIDERPETTNLYGKKYYDYEDALVEFILSIIREIKGE